MLQDKQEEEFSLKQFFVPLTTLKAIHIIVIVGFIVFGNVLFNGFVADDFGQIVTNNSIHSAANIPTFFTTSTFNQGNGISGDYYKPLLLTTFTLIHSIGGQNAFLFHLLQIILYIINAILVFILFKKFLRKEWALAISVIFLVHPINQEVGAYISDLQDVMFFFFGVLALLISSGKKSKYVELKVFSLLLLSVLSKETGIAFVFINIFYIFLFRKDRLKETIIYTLPFIISYSIIHTLAVGFPGPNEFHISRLSLFERLMNIPLIIFYYLQTFIFPKNLAVSYDWVVTSISFVNFYLPLAIISLFIAVVFFLGKILYQRNFIQFRWFIFFVLWFVTGLSLHLQLIPLDGTVATRWFYLPIVGLLGMIGIVLQNFVNSKNATNVLLIVFILLAIILSIRTIERNMNFKDNMALMCHDADQSHDNFTLENSCGFALSLAGLNDKARGYFERSIKLAPYYGMNSYGLGTVLMLEAEKHKNRVLLTKAEIVLKTSIKNEPGSPFAYESLSYLYAHYYDADIAKSFIVSSLEKFPKNYKIWFNLAILEYQSGHNSAALEAIKNAYALNPNDPETADFYYALTNNKNVKIERSRNYFNN